MLGLLSFTIGTLIVLAAPFIGVALVAAAGCVLTIGGAVAVSQS